MAKQGGQSGLNNVLRFSKPQSLVDEGFWHRFCTLKLSRLGLDESPIPITGFYAPCTYTTVSNNLNLRSESLPSDEVGQSSVSSHGDRNKCPVPGTLYNFNTFEGYNAVDRDRLLKEEAKKVLEDIRTGRAVENPALLSRFFLIAFADLKRWTFNYLFAFPTPVLNLPAKLVQLKPASQWFTAEEAEYVKAACEEWRKSSLTAGVPFFLVSIASNSQTTIRHLKDWEACQGDGQKVLFGFYDPCHIPNIPGWPLCNFLALIHSRWNLESVHFLCYKEPKGRLDLGFSLVGEALLTVPQGWEDQENVPDASGWELDKNGKYAIRSIDLSRSMEPIRLAKSSGHMNLKLMTWRAWPSLDLAKLYSLKCLLLGAGTLGCQVARSLMAWGIDKITLLDSGKVAMSNPLRQSLYTFNDCLNGGSFKALAAAKNLKEIFPPVEAEGIVMAIPMPGHPMTSQEEESVLEDCKRLHDLIDSHDAVFLLTDTRESRWLPTLLCANANKITITAALGFDSFLVMRHGPGPFSSTRDLKSEVVNVASTDKDNLELNDRGRQRLGCYFCNDVVAPTDSTSNRTLDQQCTVTRPGLAAIASSLAVELLVNILHHPNGIYADGEISNSSGSGSSEQAYGILPHQIRGSLFQFSQMTLLGQASNSCTACCSTVVSEYRRRGKEFLLQAINHPTYLEDLTGLTELMKSAGSFTFDWDADKKDDEDEEDDCIEI